MRTGRQAARILSAVDRRNCLRLAVGTAAAAMVEQLGRPLRASAQGSSSLRDILDSGADTVCNLRNGADVRRFYELRDFEPAWSSLPDATMAVATLRGADADGLDPATFKLDAIPTDSDSDSSQTSPETELALTDAMLSYVNQMRGARSLTVHKTFPYGLPSVTYDPVDILSRALGDDGLQDLPLTAAPSHVEYAWLRRAALAHDQKPGSSGAGQIIANMERWRWVPKPFEDTCVIVNSADATLSFISAGSVALQSRIVAGKATTPTPLFRTEIKAVIVNPYWDIPGDIAAKELLPAARRHADFLAARHIVADRPGGALRQLPGPGNPLGHIMFDMPNSFDSYLHDTPSKGLFARPDRHYSHGCMRVEQIEALASCVLSGDPDSGRDDILDAIAGGQTQSLPLPETIPVYVLYWTAVPSEDGPVSFHRDVYGWDRKVLDALRQDPPGDDGARSDCPAEAQADDPPQDDADHSPADDPPQPDAETVQPDVIPGGP